MSKKLLFSSIIILIFSLTNSFSQENIKSAPKKISGGVVNGKAISLPKPVYPAEAKEGNINGSVNVEIIIDRSGNVISAKAVSGHILLQNPAVEAAKEAKFHPTLLEGVPVEVSGTIVYNFQTQNNDSIENEDPDKDLKFLPMTIGTMLSAYEFLGSEPEIDEAFINITSVFSNFNSKFQLDEDFSTKTFEEKKLIVKKFGTIYENELNSDDKWQFKIGSLAGEIMGKFGKDEQNIQVMNAVELKIMLSKIRDLTYSAPTGFPKHILEKFKTVGNFVNRNDLQEKRSQQEVGNAIIEAFSLVF